MRKLSDYTRVDCETQSGSAKSANASHGGVAVQYTSNCNFTDAKGTTGKSVLFELEAAIEDGEYRKWPSTTLR